MNLGIPLQRSNSITSESADELFKKYQEMLRMGIPEERISKKIKRDADLLANAAEFHAIFNRKKLRVMDRATKAKEELDLKGRNLAILPRQQEYMKMYNDLCDSDATVEEIEEQIQHEIDFLTYFKLMLEFHKEFKSSTPVTFTLTNSAVSILDERSNDSLNISNIAGVAHTYG